MERSSLAVSEDDHEHRVGRVGAPQFAASRPLIRSNNDFGSDDCRELHRAIGFMSTGRKHEDGTYINCQTNVDQLKQELQHLPATM
jgi:hypothetical protein